MRGQSMEAAMLYLFWLSVPFALMETWWDTCERNRENAPAEARIARRDVPRR
jgi:hypothetical protein